MDISCFSTCHMTVIREGVPNARGEQSVNREVNRQVCLIPGKGAVRLV